MINIEIKAFGELSGSEVYKMIHIREEVFVVEQDCVYLDCDNYDLECDHMLVWDNKALAGTLRILPAGVKYDKVSIGRVVVPMSFRGKGIAYTMMIEALDYVKQKYGDVEVTLSAQVAIKSLYEKAGFEVISDVYLEDGIDHVRMLYRG